MASSSLSIQFMAQHRQRHPGLPDLAKGSRTTEDIRSSFHRFREGIAGVDEDQIAGSPATGRVVACGGPR